MELVRKERILKEIFNVGMELRGRGEVRMIQGVHLCSWVDSHACDVTWYVSVSGSHVSGYPNQHALHLRPRHSPALAEVAHSHFFKSQVKYTLLRAAFLDLAI